MALSPETFIPSSAMANSDAPRMFCYSTGDTLATAKGANYFDNAAAAIGGLGLKDADIILVNAVDGVSFLSIGVSAGVATTASANDFA